MKLDPALEYRYNLRPSVIFLYNDTMHNNIRKLALTGKNTKNWCLNIDV